ncbi:MAG: alpha/beta fold hydrolase [Massilia sp.]
MNPWTGEIAINASTTAGFTDHAASVNGVGLHYRSGGNGRPVVLLHGFAETGH